MTVENTPLATPAELFAGEGGGGRGRWEREGVRGTSGCMHECRSEGATDGALEGVTHLGCSQASLGQTSLQELSVLSQLGLHRVQACCLQVTVSDLPPVHRALLITADEREPRRACPTHTRTHAHTHTRKQTQHTGARSTQSWIQLVGLGVS